MQHRQLPQIQASRTAAGGLISGGLLALCFPPIDWTLLAWVALAPLGVVFSSRNMTRQSWAGVYLGGLLFHLLILDWLRTLYGGAGLEGSFVTGWLFSGQIGAALFCLMVAAGRRGVLTAQLPVTIVLPLAWTSYEYLQTYLTALFDRNGAQLVSLALTQADHATVAQIADLGGAGLISLVVAAVNGFVYDAARWLVKAGQGERHWPRAARLATVPLALVAALVYGRACLDQATFEQGPVVCLMGKDDLPPLLDESRIPIDPTAAAASPDNGRPDLLVWPELAYHHVLVTPNEHPPSLAALDAVCPLANGDVHAYSNTVRQYLEQAAAKFQAGVLIGSDRLEICDNQVQRYNCLSFADPVYGLRGWYDKHHLAPFTEFTPSAGPWLQIVSRKNYTPGRQATPIVFHAIKTEKEYQVGCGLCYDVAFAEHFRQQQQLEDVAFFVVSGSEAADATGCMSQMLRRMAQLRAIETRRPIIRNTHLGFSGLIDANGRFAESRDRQPLTAPWRLGAVPLDRRVSLFSRWGDWLAPTCLGLLLAVLLLPVARAIRLPLEPARRFSGRRLPGSLWQNWTARRRAFSLLELLAVIAIIGTITAVLIPRVSTSAAAARSVASNTNRARINAAVERWYLEKGNWPANNLSDIGADPDYFPDGIPADPVNGLAYQLNATTHRVIISGGGGGK